MFSVPDARHSEPQVGTSTVVALPSNARQGQSETPVQVAVRAEGPTRCPVVPALELFPLSLFASAKEMPDSSAAVCAASCLRLAVAGCWSPAVGSAAGSPLSL